MGLALDGLLPGRRRADGSVLPHRGAIPAGRARRTQGHGDSSLSPSDCGTDQHVWGSNTHDARLIICVTDRGSRSLGEAHRPLDLVCVLPGKRRGHLSVLR